MNDQILLFISIACYLGMAGYAVRGHFRNKKRKAALQAQLDKELNEAKERAEEMGRKLAEQLTRLAQPGRQPQESDADKLRQEVEKNARRYCPPGTKYFVWRTDREWKY